MKSKDRHIKRLFRRFNDPSRNLFFGGMTRDEWDIRVGLMGCYECRCGPRAARIHGVPYCAYCVRSLFIVRRRPAVEVVS
jgi:hypothetical protein